jgi:hypothetical protein
LHFLTNLYTIKKGKFYEQGWVMNAELIRVFLMADILAMALLAFFYLRQRKLTINEYIQYGLLALLVPLLGPFLVIVLKPGLSRKTK